MKPAVSTIWQPQGLPARVIPEPESPPPPPIESEGALASMHVHISVERGKVVPLIESGNGVRLTPHDSPAVLSRAGAHVVQRARGAW